VRRILRGTAEDFLTQRGKVAKEPTIGIMDENAISKVIVDSAIEVHKILGGPGLLESVYEESLAWELVSRGLTIERQMEVVISYKGNELSSPLKLDLLVGDKVIAEVKSVALYNRIFETQALTYLRLMKLKLALVVNFGEVKVGHAIHRVVNGL
jgi:GxxExxY protein